MQFSNNDIQTLKRISTWFKKEEATGGLRIKQRLPRMIQTASGAAIGGVEVKLCKPLEDVDMDSVLPWIGDVQVWDGTITPPIATGEIIFEVNYDWMRAMHGPNMRIPKGTEAAIIRFGEEVPIATPWEAENEYLENEEVSHADLDDGREYNWNSISDRTSGLIWDELEQSNWRRGGKVGAPIWRFMWWQDNSVDEPGFQAGNTNSNQLVNSQYGKIQDMSLVYLSGSSIIPIDPLFSVVTDNGYNVIDDSANQIIAEG